MPSTNPRWVTALAKSLAEHEDAIVYQLASVDASNRPHVRSVIHRSFLTPKSTPSTPILLTTTDIRTPKVSDFAVNSSVELCWWIDPTKEQLRIAGRIFLIPSPTLRALEAEGIDWESKRQEIFNTMSSHMKASWIRPTPGKPIIGGYEASKAWPSTVKANAGDSPTNPEDAKDLVTALSNFALVLIDPTEVDYVELGVVPNKRTRFVRLGGIEGDEWSDELVVP